MVRPVIYPMAEGAAMRAYGELRTRHRGDESARCGSRYGRRLFWRRCFVAIGSVLLIAAYVDASYRLKLDPLQIAIWAIPTAVAAFVIHGFRLLRLDGRLAAIGAAESKLAAMITAEWIYWLLGAFFFSSARDRARPRTPQRWTNAAFWCLLGVSLCYGSFVPKLPAWGLGIAVIVMALIAGFGLTGSGDVRTTSEGNASQVRRAKATRSLFRR